jgi:hypothetical protein
VGGVSSSSWLKLGGSVTIVGVGFWDAKHGQTGIAPNGIELHPVLNFKGDCHKAATGGGGGGGGSCTPAIALASCITVALTTTATATEEMGPTTRSQESLTT